MKRSDKLALISFLLSCAFFLTGTLWPQIFATAGGILQVVGGILCLAFFVCSVSFGIMALLESKTQPKSKLVIAATIGMILGLAVIVYVVFPSSHGDFFYEAHAIAVLRTLSSTEELYHTNYSKYATLNELHELNYIRTEVANASTPQTSYDKYYYKLIVGDNSWSCTAIPVEPGPHHSRSFYIDITGIIRYAPYDSKSSYPANRDSKPLHSE